MENILLLNLLGKRFHIPSSIVADYPHSLLGNKLLLANYYRHDFQDYYFDRNPLLFPYILTYYTLEKKIFCPHHIPIELLEKECQFFQLNNPYIYHELNKTETYQYFQRNKISKTNSFIDSISFLTGLLFMIGTSMETFKTSSEQSWSLSYFIDLFGTLLLTSSILYQTIRMNNKKYFFLDLFSTILSILILSTQHFLIITNHRVINSLIMILKTFRLLIIIAHLRILRLILITFIKRFQTVCVLIFLNILLTGSFSEIAFAFERRQQEERTNQITMQTHFDAFWWATSLSFTIGFGYTDPHSTLTIIGRFCSYMLIFFGLLFNGLILQELIKGFLKIYREERRDQ